MVNVLVVDNTIKTISATSIQTPSGYSTLRLAGGGRTLMPGLIDAHAHLFIKVEPKILLNPETPAEKPEQIARNHSKATLMSVLTTVRDMAGPVFKLKREIDRGDIEGPRIYPSGTIISQASGHGDFSEPADLPHSLGGPLPIATKPGLSTIADGTDQVLAAGRYNLRNGASQIKLAAGAESPRASIQSKSVSTPLLSSGPQWMPPLITEPMSRPIPTHQHLCFAALKRASK